LLNSNSSGIFYLAQILYDIRSKVWTLRNANFLIKQTDFVRQSRFSTPFSLAPCKSFGIQRVCAMLVTNNQFILWTKNGDNVLIVHSPLGASYIKHYKGSFQPTFGFCPRLRDGQLQGLGRLITFTHLSISKCIGISPLLGFCLTSHNIILAFIQHHQLMNDFFEFIILKKGVTSPYTREVTILHLTIAS
ncbi:hypothetical protein CR513_52818, partial [Mucuna pruriens]